jgi:hypothetical protein
VDKLKAPTLGGLAHCTFQTLLPVLMHYAPFYYVFPTNLTANAVADRKTHVEDGSKFQADFPVKSRIRQQEWNEVEASSVTLYS